MVNDPFSSVMYEDERVRWQQLSMQERWRESMNLWQVYLTMGGSLDPEPDSHSPFYFDDEPTPETADGLPDLPVMRHGPV
jgi:hypothetical protein